MPINYSSNGGFIGSGLNRDAAGVFGLNSAFFAAGALYKFETFTFTTGGATGRFGPSYENLTNSYDTTINTWLLNTEFFSVDSGIQIWTVPKNGTYRILCAGSEGGSNESDTTRRPGRGAVMQGDFNLIAGERLNILVGQRGESGSFGCGAAGGSGGSFVVKEIDSIPGNSEILIIAGGGGGQGNGTGGQGLDGQITSFGTDGNGGASGIGGANGNGGGVPSIGCSNNEGSGGGGFFTDGAVNSGNGSVQSGGAAYINGGFGGQSNNFSEGGFGGGGGGRYGAGGGGGYSGGGAGSLNGNCSCNEMTGGGGGGSFNSGSNPQNTVGNNTGDGRVEITLL